MSLRFKDFRKIVEKNGNQKMLDLAAVAREYMIQLNQAFADRDVTYDSLEEEWGKFMERMGKRTVFDKYQNMRGKLFMMDVNHIVRHIWEYTNQAGVTKNGDNLRKVCPLLYENDTIRTPLEVFTDLLNR